jgi:hypothetical protein
VTAAVSPTGAHPCYGEDNQYIYDTVLGMSTSEIEAPKEEGVI